MEDQSKSDCITGIYLITHIESGIPYVGMTGAEDGFEGRWEGHRKALRNKSHNPIFQNYWDKYGEDAFSFTVHTYIPQGNLPYCEFRKLLKQEESRIWKLFPKTLNGNILDSGGMTHLPEVAQKIREANLEKMKDPEYKAKKLADINSPEGVSKKIASNKSERIRKMRREQMQRQKENQPELLARFIAAGRRPEVQEKANIGKRAKWADPVWAAKMKEIIKKSTMTPEVAEKRRIATQAQWDDPVIRARRTEANKRAAATRKANRLKNLVSS